MIRHPPNRGGLRSVPPRVGFHRKDWKVLPVFSGESLGAASEVSLFSGEEAA